MDNLFDSSNYNPADLNTVPTDCYVTFRRIKAEDEVKYDIFY